MMNENTMGLLQKAREDVLSVVPENSFSFDVLVYERFAERIVRECCGRLDKVNMGGVGEQTKKEIKEEMKKHLKDHFGLAPSLQRVWDK